MKGWIAGLVGGLFLETAPHGRGARIVDVEKAVQTHEGLLCATRRICGERRVEFHRFHSFDAPLRGGGLVGPFVCGPGRVETRLVSREESDAS